MKTKVKFLLILLLILFGCKEKDTIEVIPNYDEIYLPMSQVDSRPELIGGNEKDLSDKINEEIKDLKIKERVTLSYKLLIDEDGNVDKVEVHQSPNSKFTDIAVNYFENWKFKPGIKDQKNVKSQYWWYFNINKSEINLNYINKNDFLLAVEQMPEPIGGINEIQEKLHYPEIAKRAGVEGKVYIKAYIDENGNVAATEVMRGVGAGLEEAAEDAIMETKFEPGMQHGKKVKVQVVVPILFKLD
jgi:TonB family protein